MKELKLYEQACNDLSDKFLKELYPKDFTLYDDAYWIGDKIGDVLAFSDMFVDMNQMADYFKYDYTPEQFMNWYWDYIDEERENLNMKNYKLRNSKLK